MAILPRTHFLPHLSTRIRSLKKHMRLVLIFLLIVQLVQTIVESGGDLGSIECINGKWQVDTKIISLIVVCPIQISWESLLCVFKRLGLYDHDKVNEDFHIYLCSLFATRELIEYCIAEFSSCLNSFGGVANLELFMIPVGVCLWEAIHGKMNCTI